MAKSRNSNFAKDGRAAIEAGRGRGISIHTHGAKYTKNGKTYSGGRSCKGLVSYVMDKPGAEMIFSNSGVDKKSILKDFNLSASRRPEIEKRVGHISLSLPPTTKKMSALEWNAVLEVMRKKLGLEDFPSVASRHSDTDHDHLHFVYSRINDRGEVFDDRFLKLRLASLEDEIEDYFKLPLTPRPKNGDELPNFTPGEAAVTIKTGIKPPRLVLAEAIREAVVGTPNADEFVQRLAIKGINAIANIASTGKMNGYSFTYQKQSFKGSSVNAKWSKLSGEINYESVTNDQGAANTKPVKFSPNSITANKQNSNHSNGLVASLVDIPIKRIIDSEKPDVEEGVCRDGVASRGKTSGRFIRIEELGYPNIDGVGSDSFCLRPQLPIGFISKSHNEKYLFPAYFIATLNKPDFKHSKPIAYGMSDGGVHIPNPNLLTDDQLAELIFIVSNGSPIVISGTEEFRFRAARIADLMNIEHDQYIFTGSMQLNSEFEESNFDVPLL